MWESVFSHPSGGQDPRTTDLGCSRMTDGAQENHPISVNLFPHLYNEERTQNLSSYTGMRVKSSDTTKASGKA